MLVEEAVERWRATDGICAMAGKFGKLQVGNKPTRASDASDKCVVPARCGWTLEYYMIGDGLGLDVHNLDTKIISKMFRVLLKGIVTGEVLFEDSLDATTKADVVYDCAMFKFGNGMRNLRWEWRNKSKIVVPTKENCREMLANLLRVVGGLSGLRARSTAWQDERPDAMGALTTDGHSLPCCCPVVTCAHCDTGNLLTHIDVPQGGFTRGRLVSSTIEPGTWYCGCCAGDLAYIYQATALDVVANVLEAYHSPVVSGQLEELKATDATDFYRLMPIKDQKEIVRADKMVIQRHWRALYWSVAHVPANASKQETDAARRTHTGFSFRPILGCCCSNPDVAIDYSCVQQAAVRALFGHANIVGSLLPYCLQKTVTFSASSDWLVTGWARDDPVTTWDVIGPGVMGDNYWACRMASRGNALVIMPLLQPELNVSSDGGSCFIFHTNSRTGLPLTGFWRRALQSTTMEINGRCLVSHEIYRGSHYRCCSVQAIDRVSNELAYPTEEDDMYVDLTRLLPVQLNVTGYDASDPWFKTRLHRGLLRTLCVRCMESGTSLDDLLDMGFSYARSRIITNTTQITHDEVTDNEVYTHAIVALLMMKEVRSDLEPHCSSLLQGLVTAVEDWMVNKVKDWRLVGDIGDRILGGSVKKWISNAVAKLRSEYGSNLAQGCPAGVTVWQHALLQLISKTPRQPAVASLHSTVSDPAPCDHHQPGCKHSGEKKCHCCRQNCHEYYCDCCRIRPSKVAQMEDITLADIQKLVNGENNSRDAGKAKQKTIKLDKPQDGCRTDRPQHPVTHAQPVATHNQDETWRVIRTPTVSKLLMKLRELSDGAYDVSRATGELGHEFCLAVSSFTEWFNDLNDNDVAVNYIKYITEGAHRTSRDKWSLTVTNDLAGTAGDCAIRALEWSTGGLLDEGFIKTTTGKEDWLTGEDIVLACKKKKLNVSIVTPDAVMLYIHDYGDDMMMAFELITEPGRPGHVRCVKLRSLSYPEVTPTSKAAVDRDMASIRSGLGLGDSGPGADDVTDFTEAVLTSEMYWRIIHEQQVVPWNKLLGGLYTIHDQKVWSNSCGSCTDWHMGSINEVVDAGAEKAIAMIGQPINMSDPFKNYDWCCNESKSCISEPSSACVREAGRCCYDIMSTVSRCLLGETDMVTATRINVEARPGREWVDVDITGLNLKSGDLICVRSMTSTPRLYGIRHTISKTLQVPVEKNCRGTVCVMTMKTSVGSLLRRMVSLIRCSRLTTESLRMCLDNSSCLVASAGYGKTAKLVGDAHKHKWTCAAMTRAAVSAINERAGQKIAYSLEHCSLPNVSVTREMLVDECTMMDFWHLCCLVNKGVVGLHLFGDPDQVGSPDMHQLPGNRCLPSVMSLLAPQSVQQVNVTRRIGEPLATELCHVMPELTSNADHATNFSIHSLSEHDWDGLTSIVADEGPNQILTFYTRALEVLKQVCPKTPSAKVHGFQGQEAEKVLVVHTKHGPGGTWGLSMNANYCKSAWTRASRKLIIVLMGSTTEPKTLADMHLMSTALGYKKVTEVADRDMRTVNEGLVELMDEAGPLAETTLRAVDLEPLPVVELLGEDTVNYLESARELDACMLVDAPDLAPVRCRVMRRLAKMREILKRLASAADARIPRSDTIVGLATNLIGSIGRLMDRVRLGHAGWGAGEGQLPLDFERPPEEMPKACVPLPPAELENVLAGIKGSTLRGALSTAFITDNNLSGCLVTLRQSGSTATLEITGPDELITLRSHGFTAQISPSTGQVVSASNWFVRAAIDRCLEKASLEDTEINIARRIDAGGITWEVPTTAEGESQWKQLMWMIDKDCAQQQALTLWLKPNLAIRVMKVHNGCSYRAGANIVCHGKLVLQVGATYQSWAKRSVVSYATDETGVFVVGAFRRWLLWDGFHSPAGPSTPLLLIKPDLKFTAMLWKDRVRALTDYIPYYLANHRGGAFNTSCGINKHWVEHLLEVNEVAARYPVHVGQLVPALKTFYVSLQDGRLMVFDRQGSSSFKNNDTVKDTCSLIHLLLSDAYEQVEPQEPFISGEWDVDERGLRLSLVAHKALNTEVAQYDQVKRAKLAQLSSIPKKNNILVAGLIPPRLLAKAHDECWKFSWSADGAAVGGAPIMHMLDSAFCAVLDEKYPGVDKTYKGLHSCSLQNCNIAEWRVEISRQTGRDRALAITAERQLTRILEERQSALGLKQKLRDNTNNAVQYLGEWGAGLDASQLRAVASECTTYMTVPFTDSAKEDEYVKFGTGRVLIGYQGSDQTTPVDEKVHNAAVTGQPLDLGDGWVILEPVMQMLGSMLVCVRVTTSDEVVVNSTTAIKCRDVVTVYGPVVRPRELLHSKNWRSNEQYDVPASTMRKLQLRATLPGCDHEQLLSYASQLATMTIVTNTAASVSDNVNVPSLIMAAAVTHAKASHVHWALRWIMGNYGEPRHHDPLTSSLQSWVEQMMSSLAGCANPIIEGILNNITSTTSAKSVLRMLSGRDPTCKYGVVTYKAQPLRFGRRAAGPANGDQAAPHRTSGEVVEDEWFDAHESGPEDDQPHPIDLGREAQEAENDTDGARLEPGDEEVRELDCPVRMPPVGKTSGSGNSDGSLAAPASPTRIPEATTTTSQSAHATETKCGTGPVRGLERARVNDFDAAIYVTGSRGDLSPFLRVVELLRQRGSSILVLAHADWAEHFKGCAYVGLPVNAAESLTATQSGLGSGSVIGLVQMWKRSKVISGTVRDLVVEWKVRAQVMFTVPWAPEASLVATRIGAELHTIEFFPWEVVMASNLSTVTWKSAGAQVPLTRNNSWLALDGRLVPDNEKVGRCIGQLRPLGYRWEEKRLSDDSSRFLHWLSRKSGSNIVMLTYGSLEPPKGWQWVRDLAAMLVTAGCRVVVNNCALNPDPSTEDDSISGNILNTHNLDYDVVLSKCAVTLFHGGVGTLQDVLRARSVPVILPCFCDQFLWARFVVERGLGMALEPQASVSDACGAVLGALSKLSKFSRNIRRWNELPSVDPILAQDQWLALVFGESHNTSASQAVHVEKGFARCAEEDGKYAVTRAAVGMYKATATGRISYNPGGNNFCVMACLKVLCGRSPTARARMGVTFEMCAPKMTPSAVLRMCSANGLNLLLVFTSEVDPCDEEEQTGIAMVVDPDGPWLPLSVLTPTSGAELHARLMTVGSVDLAVTGTRGVTEEEVLGRLREIQDNLLLGNMGRLLDPRDPLRLPALGEMGISVGELEARLEGRHLHQVWKTTPGKVYGWVKSESGRAAVGDLNGSTSPCAELVAYMSDGKYMAGLALPLRDEFILLHDPLSPAITDGPVYRLRLPVLRRFRASHPAHQSLNVALTMVEKSALERAGVSCSLTLLRDSTSDYILWLNNFDNRPHHNRTLAETHGAICSARVVGTAKGPLSDQQVENMLGSVGQAIDRWCVYDGSVVMCSDMDTEAMAELVAHLASLHGVGAISAGCTCYHKEPLTGVLSALFDWWCVEVEDSTMAQKMIVKRRPTTLDDWNACSCHPSVSPTHDREYKVLPRPSDPAVSGMLAVNSTNGQLYHKYGTTDEERIACAGCDSVLLIDSTTMATPVGASEGAIRWWGDRTVKKKDTPREPGLELLSSAGALASDMSHTAEAGGHDLENTHAEVWMTGLMAKTSSYMVENGPSLNAILVWGCRDLTDRLTLFGPLEDGLLVVKERPGKCIEVHKRVMCKFPSRSRVVINEMAYETLNALTGRYLSYKRLRKFTPDPDWLLAEFCEAYFRADWRQVVAEYQAHPVTLDSKASKAWLDERRGALKIYDDLHKWLTSAGTGRPINVMNVHSKAESLLKDSPIIDQRKQQARLIVWMPKFFACIFSPVFLQAKKRLHTLLREGIIYADGKTPDQLSALVRAMTRVNTLFENDLTKQDRQTDEPILQFEKMMYRFLGVDSSVLDCWFVVHGKWLAKCKSGECIMTARRLTGQATTALGNVITNMQIHAKVIRTEGNNIRGALFLGDDMLVLCEREPWLQGYRSYVENGFNMQCKPHTSDEVGVFCCMLCYRTPEGCWELGPDVLRLVRRFEVANGAQDVNSIRLRAMSYLMWLGPFEATNTLLAKTGWPIRPTAWFDGHTAMRASATKWGVTEQEVGHELMHLYDMMTSEGESLSYKVIGSGGRK